MNAYPRSPLVSLTTHLCARDAVKALTRAINPLTSESSHNCNRFMPDSGQIYSTTDPAQHSDLGVWKFAHTPRGREDAR